MLRTFHFLVCEIVSFLVTVPLISGTHVLLQSERTSVPKGIYRSRLILCVALCTVHTTLHCACPGSKPHGNSSRQTTLWIIRSDSQGSCLTCALICQLELPRVYVWWGHQVKSFSAFNMLNFIKPVRTEMRRTCTLSNLVEIGQRLNDQWHLKEAQRRLQKPCFLKERAVCLSEFRNQWSIPKTSEKNFHYPHFTSDKRGITAPSSPPQILQKGQMSYVMSMLSV